MANLTHIINLSDLAPFFAGGGHDDIGHYRRYSIPAHVDFIVNMEHITANFMPQSFMDGRRITLYLIDGKHYDFGQVFQIPFSRLKINFG